MLFDKLRAYAEEDIYPFHMPGHKRNSKLLGNTLPYDIDITEIDGFDNLHNAEGVISDVQRLASEVYGCANAFLLVNGATCGILAAIRTMTTFGDKVIVARNCHKSVYNAIELCGLKPVYIYPEIDAEYGISSSITPEQINFALEENSDAKLIILTSPTYEGVVSDIESISETAHKYDIPLFVDEAHGAHFVFSEEFPKEAVNSGADVAVVSLHKTLPSLTQTALLLTADDRFKDKIEENLSIFETSSPSYVLMSSIEKSLGFCSENKDLFSTYIQRLRDFSEFCNNLKNIKVLCYGNDRIENHRFYDFDISKLVVSIKKLNISGADFAQILRTKYNIEVEMAYSNYAILITSVCDTDFGFSLLKTALNEIDNEISACESEIYKNHNQIITNSVFIPFEKNKYKGEFTDFDKSLNKISLEYVWTYPPGIPLIVPGEVITKEIVDEVKNLSRKSVNILSTKNEMPDKIYTAKFD